MCAGHGGRSTALFPFWQPFVPFSTFPYLIEITSKMNISHQKTPAFRPFWNISSRYLIPHSQITKMNIFCNSNGLSTYLCIFSNWSQYCSSRLWGGTNEMKCDHIPILLLERKGNILWSLKTFLEERASQGAGQQLFSM